MKRHILILTFLINCTMCSLAQPSWLWANSAGGPSYESGAGICTDASGNVLITGIFSSSSITFGSITLTNTNTGIDFFIVKYDASGNVLWAKSGGGNGYDFGIHISTDASGNVLLTGHFTSDSITFGTITLTNTSNAAGYDFFVVKYDPSGNVLWANSPSGTMNEFSKGISTDGSGNILVAGSFNSATITFGTTVLINSGNTNLFIVKYDASGNLLWAKSTIGTYIDIYGDITTDDNDNVMVTGSFNGDSIIFGTIVLTNSGVSYNVFVAKYDSSGSVLWAKSSAGDGGRAKGIATDANGNVLIAGEFGPPITFGTIVLTGPGFYVVKYDASGNVLWAKSVGGNNISHGISADADKNVLITGNFDSTYISFGNSTLTTNGLMDIFVMKYDSSGNELWAVSAGGIDDDESRGICMDSGGNILLTGFFYSPTIAFGATTLINTDTSGNNQDVLVAKLDSTIINGIVKENIASNSITFYPNPSNSILNLLLNTKENIVITNLTGEIILQKDAIGKIELDISSLSPGLYFIKAGTEMRKFVKQ